MPNRYVEKKRRAKRDEYLKRNYGITADEYAAMLEAQDNTCAICGGVNTNGKPLYVDHNHVSGAVRGLLCNNCNFLLGLTCDSVVVLAAAIEYLSAEVTC